MSLFSRVYRAVQEWRQHRGTSKSRKRAVLNMEMLDQRQLLAVNFTGVVLNDFPPGTAGISYLTDPMNRTPIIAPPAAIPIVGESGLEIDQIAVNYDSTSDTLSIGLLGPVSTVGTNIGQRVIAGDVDNNGNNSTTSAAAAAQGFLDFPGISGTESMGALIDLSGGTNSATESIAAGTPPGTTSPPQVYEVAQVLGSSSVPTAFGIQLSNNTGSFSLINSPTNGAYEFTITHFSELYQAETGHALSASSVIDVGGFGTSDDDGGTSEEFFHVQPVTISNVTTPVPPPPVPPPPVVPPVPPVPPPPPPPAVCSPTILINPHENRHVNTAHQTNVRVTVLSSSGFNATQIDPNTVRFGGAAPIAEFSRIQLHDSIESETFVFKGIDITLPPGLTEATISGVTNSGMAFSSSELIFNRDDSFYPPGEVSARDARLARVGLTVAQEMAASGASATAAAVPASAINGPTISLGAPTGQGSLTINPVVPAAPTTVKITPRQAAVNRATARKDALLSTAAASPFIRTASKPTPVPTAAATPTTSVHDAALADLSPQTGQ